MENLEELESGVDSKNLFMQLIQAPAMSDVDLDVDNDCQGTLVNNDSLNNSGAMISDPFVSFDQSNDKFATENFDGVTLSDNDATSGQAYGIIAAYPSSTGYYITSDNGDQVYEIPPSSITQQIFVNGGELFLLQEDQPLNESPYEMIMLQPVINDKSANNSSAEFAINWPTDQITSSNENIQLILGPDNNVTTSNQESLLRVAQKPIKHPNYCSICDINFDSSKSYRQHMKTHENDKPFKCEVCGTKFNHVINLKVHIATEHCGQETNYECPVCKKSFSRQASFFGHLRSHEIDEDLVCFQCFKTFKTQLLLDCHYREHKKEGYLPAQQYNKGYKCKLCPDVYLTSIGMLRRHYTQCHPNPAKKKSSLQPDEADVKSGETSTSDGVNTARKSKQKAKVYLTDIINAVKSTKLLDTKKSYYMKSRKTYACSYCDKKFAKSCLLKRHLVCHTKEKKFTCTICRKGFTQKSSLKTHMNTHDSNIGHSCPQCGKVLRYKHTFRDHVCNQRALAAAIQRRAAVACWSQSAAPSSNNILRSILVDNSDQNCLPNVTESIRTKCNVYKRNKFACRICWTRFRNCKTLLTHWKCHHDHRNPTCEQCRKVFLSELILKSHTPCHAVKISQNLCQHCHKLFPSAKHLSHHLKCVARSDNTNRQVVERFSYPKPLVFNEETRQLIPVDNPVNFSSNQTEDCPTRLFKCCKCPRSYKSAAHLKAHMKQHHDNPKRVTCSRCGKSFCSDSTLNNHIRSKHLSPGYKCTVCPHNSSTQTLLKRHMKIHSGAKPYVCPICKKNFKTKSYCQVHIKNHGDKTGVQVNLTTENESILNTLFSNSDQSTNVYADEAQSFAVQNEVPLINYEITDLTSNYQSFVGEDAYIDPNLEQYTIQDVNGDLMSISANEADQVKMSQIFNLVRQTDDSPAIDNSCQLPALTLQSDLLSTGIIDDAPPEATPSPVNFTKSLSRTKCPLLMEALFRDEETTAKLPDEPTDDQKAVSKFETFYGCTKCDHVFVYPRDLVAHAKLVHVIDKPYTCPKCSKCFSSQVAVQVHEYKHTPSEKYVCPACSQEFANFMSVTRHVINYHSKERDLYKCTRCQLSYNNIRELRHHVEIHQEESETIALDKTLIRRGSHKNNNLVFNEEQNEILANVIPTEDMTLSEKYLITAAKKKKYPNANSIERFNLNENQSLYSCKECHKSFARPSTLKRHSYVHSGVKPFKCNQCTRSFKDKMNLIRHMEDFHSTKRRVYSCHVCCQRFVSKSGLKSHMLIHTNNLPFKCSKCDSAFRSDALRDLHMKKRHGQSLYQQPSKNIPSLATIAAGICGGRANTQAFNSQEFDSTLSQMIYIDSIDDPPFHDSLTEVVPLNSLKVDYIKPIVGELNLGNDMLSLDETAVSVAGALSTSDNDIIIISNELGEVSQFCLQSNSFIKTTNSNSNNELLTDASQTIMPIQPQAHNEPNIDRSDESTPTKGEAKWLCNFCKGLFSAREDYQTHECTNPLALASSQTIKNQAIKQRLNNLPSSKRFKCKQCDATFSYKVELNKHLKADHPPTTDSISAVCQICNSQFFSHSDLNSHMREHYQSRAHLCKYCDGRFSNHHQLAQHLHSCSYIQ